METRLLVPETKLLKNLIHRALNIVSISLTTDSNIIYLYNYVSYLPTIYPDRFPILAAFSV